MGGPNGLIDVATSVSGMMSVIEGLSPTGSGQFFNYDGSIIPGNPALSFPGSASDLMNHVRRILTDSLFHQPISMSGFIPLCYSVLI